MQNYGLNDKTVLDELVLWLSDKEVGDFLQDLKDGCDLDYVEED